MEAVVVGVDVERDAGAAPAVEGSEYVRGVEVWRWSRARSRTWGRPRGFVLGGPGIYQRHLWQRGSVCKAFENKEEGEVDRREESRVRDDERD